MWILYTTLRGGLPEIWLMKSDGSEPKFVTKGSQGSWAPDGKSILLIRDNQTFVRDLASGKERVVTPKEWERGGVPAFAPDDKHFAVASRHLGNINIFILSLDGKENERLKAGEACCTPQWSKDGKNLSHLLVRGLDDPQHYEAPQGKFALPSGYGCEMGSSTISPSAVAASLRSRSAEISVTGSEPPA